MLPFLEFGINKRVLKLLVEDAYQLFFRIDDPYTSGLEFNMIKSHFHDDLFKIPQYPHQNYYHFYQNHMIFTMIKSFHCESFSNSHNTLFLVDNPPN